MADDNNSNKPDNNNAAPVNFNQTGEQIVAAAKQAQVAQKQFDSLTAAIKSGKESLDEYIVKAREITNTYTESKIAAKGFYEGVSLANEKLKEEIDLLGKVTSALEQEYRASIQASIEANNTFAEKLKELGPLQGQIGQNQKENIKTAKEEIQLKEEEIKVIERDIVAAKLWVDEFELKQKLQEKQAELTKLNTDLTNANNIEEVQRTAEIVTQTQENAKRLAQMMSENNLRKLQGESIDKVSQATAGLTDKLFGASRQSNIFTSAVLSISDGSKALTNIGGAISESFLKPENALNRFFNFLNENLIKSTFEFDKALSEVNKQTGGFRKEFEQVGMRGFGPAIGNMANYGVGLKELGKAYGDLSNKIGGFNDLAASQRDLLMRNAATMENLGVSAQSYASMVSTFMGAIGKTAEGADAMVSQLARDAIAAGKNVGEYIKSFEQVMPKIVGYAKDATQIFKELNALSSMTKGVMSAGDLEGFASKFDTWDSAAETVSKLNVALGGASVNIADIMNVDPSEKLMMIKRSFEDSGQEFDKLSRGYKEMLAESFGGDVAKAAAFYNGSLAEANAMLSESAATEEELAERKKQSAAAMDKLSKAIEGMKLSLTPVIDVIAMIAEKIAWMNETFSPLGTFLAVAIPLGFMAIKGAISMVSSMMSSTVGTATGKIIADLEKVKVKAGEAAAAIKAINAPNPGAPPAVPGVPPVTPGAPPVAPGAPGGGMNKLGKVMGGIGAAVGIIGLVSSLSGPSQPTTISNSNYLINKPQEENAPTTDDADFSSRRPIFTLDDSNRPMMIAKTNKRDGFASVRATTPESRTKEKEIERNNSVLRDVTSVDKLSNIVTKNSENMREHVQNFANTASEKVLIEKEKQDKQSLIQPIVKVDLGQINMDEYGKLQANKISSRVQQDQNTLVQSDILSADSRLG